MSNPVLPEQILHYIGGKHLPSADGATFEVTEPVTNRVYARAAAGGPEDVDRAVEAATAAFETGPWPGMAARARARVLNRIADAIEARGEFYTEYRTVHIALGDTRVPRFGA